MNREKSPQQEQSRFKKGDIVIYNFPRMKRGIKVKPETVIIQYFCKDGKACVLFKTGVRRDVKIENLEHVQ